MQGPLSCASAICLLSNSFEVHIIDALVMIFIPLSITLYYVILTNYELLIFGTLVSSHLTILHSESIISTVNRETEV